MARQQAYQSKENEENAIDEEKGCVPDGSFQAHHFHGLHDLNLWLGMIDWVLADGEPNDMDWTWNIENDGDEGMTFKLDKTTNNAVSRSSITVIN